MTTKHTPGPWRVRKVGYETLIGVSDDSFVAQVYSATGRNSQKANARLIAAAPDLLESCQKLIDYRNRNTRNWQTEKAEDYFNRIRAAISKAEGDDDA